MTVRIETKRHEFHVNKVLMDPVVRPQGTQKKGREL